MRRGMGAALAMTLLTFGACGDAQKETATSPAARLAAAVEKTLAVESMVITISGGDDDDDEADGSVTEYQAPDRARSEMPGGLEMRIIGNVTYMEDMAGPGRWMSRTAKKSPRFPPLLGLYALENPESVTESGDELTAKLRGDQGTAVVRLRDGYVVRSEHTFEGGSEPIMSVWEFSGFDEPVEPIEPPPADQVTEQEQDEMPPEPKEATLPPPSGSADSSLQLRGVLDEDADGCAATSTNPSPTAPARLRMGGEGACFELDVAELEITSVMEIKAMEEGDGRVSVDFTLHEDDGERLNALGRKHLGNRLALVAFGQVQSAPTIHTDDFGGRATISGLTPQMASDLVAALT